MLRYWSKALVSALMLVALPFEKAYDFDADREAMECLKGNMSSVIMLDTRLFSNQSKDIGFNYALLNAFSDYTGLKVNIESRPVSDGCWRNLVAGNYQLMAFEARDSLPIPPEFANNVLLSMPIRDNMVWAVPMKNEYLINYVNVFLQDIKRNGRYQDIERRHYRSYHIEPFLDSDLKANALSPYDDIVKKYGNFTGVDWRLLSAIIYQESRYNMATTSMRNAKGLMQVLESTAAHYGVDDVYDPELNVKAGTLHFSHLVNAFSDEGMSDEEIIKFALAAYNAGEARIEQCRRVADSLGLDRNKWEDVVKAFDSMPNFGGREETRSYVEKVMAKFEDYKRIIE